MRRTNKKTFVLTGWCAHTHTRRHLLDAPRVRRMGLFKVLPLVASRFRQRGLGPFDETSKEVNSLTKPYKLKHLSVCPLVST